MPTPAGPSTRNRLRFNVLLETLSDEEFQRFEGALRESRFPPDGVIIEDEVDGEEVFFLVEGRVRISKKTAAGDDQVLAILHPGDCFGELELIAGRPRCARIVALDPVLTYALPRGEFDRLLATVPSFAVRLLQVLSVRVRAMNYQFIREVNRRIFLSGQELAKMERLIEATRKVNSTLDLEELLDIILEMALRSVDGDRGTVYLVDESASQLWTKTSRLQEGGGRVTIRLPIGKGIAGYVAATGDVINIPDAYVDPRFSPDIDRQTGFRTQSILCVPMRNKDGRIIGVFQLLNKRRGVFTEDDARFIDALSVHAAVAIENARLYESERQKIRIERDLAAAREVQMSLLPKLLPVVAGYEFAACTIPALEVAGDLYDVLEVGPDRYAFHLGDVSGKGLPAALLMASMQATLRDRAHASPSVTDCVRSTNTTLFQNSSPEKFVTLLFAELDCAGHRLTYCNGGHEQPFFFSADGHERRLGTGGVILGIMEDYPFEQETVEMAPGDVVVVYSDGISDAMSPSDERFGEERLEEIIRASRAAPAAELQERILAAVRAHTGGASQLDDMTLVIVRRLPAA